jgi:release factor glutamine methyltransferase
VPDAGAGTVTWGRLAAEAAAALADAGCESPEVDARRIVEQASGYEGAEYHLALDRPATVRGVAHLDGMVARRAAGEPLQYVLGRWAFRTLDLLVDRRVLIPRPETEAVVGHALDELDRMGPGPAVAADLGTGSGAIALSLVAERPRVEVWATDQSAAALDVAVANMAGVGTPAARVRVAHGSWYGALPPELRGRLALVVSNPPYVAATDDLPPVVRHWEPAAALVSGPTGLEAVAEVVAGARAWLAPGAAVVVEIAPHQAGAAVDLALGAGLRDAEVRPDLAGRPRALVARRPA